MPTSGHSQRSQDIPLVPSSVEASGSYARTSAKRPREDSDPGSDSETEDNNKADMEQMDFEPTIHVTPTQALEDETELPEYVVPELPPPLNAEHAALRSDFEIITQEAMERLYRRISEDIMKSAADSTIAFQKTTDQLQRQISSMGIRISQLQQQLLSCQKPVHVPTTTLAVPTTAPSKKVLRLQLAKRNAGTDMGGTATTATTDTTPQVMSTPSPPDQPGSCDPTRCRPV